MKRIPIILLMLLPLLSFGQERIVFQAMPDQLREVSRTVSIDRVEGTTVTAYASEAELAALKALGYSYTLAPEAQPKVINMATSVAQLRQWDRYPTYDTYVEYMQQMAQQYPSLCRLDTIGTSVQNRLILCLRIHGAGQHAPEFFYSSTMHGDEVTGFYFMLRLIDTLLTGYGTDPELTQLADAVDIYINPLANPDGTYAGGNNSVQGSMRYNANWVDLNRNYPCPFGVQAANSLQQENEAMIAYVSAHHFRLSANLHGGAEVMNYPWDSYESWEQQHPQAEWWKAVCQRFVDTARLYSQNHFNDVTSSGYIAGGDWYVISNGRQDYMNYFHDCLELTMELSSTKKLSTDRLDDYWRFQHRSLINYIKETPDQGTTQGIATPSLEPVADGMRYLVDPMGRILRVESASKPLQLQGLHRGVYLLREGGKVRKILVKQIEY